jgi:hypothetical protein
MAAKDMGRRAACTVYTQYVANWHADVQRSLRDKKGNGLTVALNRLFTALRAFAQRYKPRVRVTTVHTQVDGGFAVAAIGDSYKNPPWFTLRASIHTFHVSFPGDSDDVKLDHATPGEMADAIARALFRVVFPCAVYGDDAMTVDMALANARYIPRDTDAPPGMRALRTWDCTIDFAADARGNQVLDVLEAFVFRAVQPPSDGKKARRRANKT